MALLAALFLAGCAGPSAHRADEIATVKRGVVVEMKPITLAGTTTGVGAAAGAGIGAVAGINAGDSWRSMLIGAVVGQAIGALAGNAAEKKLTETEGVEVTVRLDAGEEMAIAKRAEEVASLRIGDRVRILLRGNRALLEKEAAQ